MLRTKQQLFARFEETFDRILDDAGERVTARHVHMLAAEYLDALFDLGAEQPQAVRILAWEAAEGWQTFASCAPSQPQTWSQRVLVLLKRAQAAGIVRAELDPLVFFTTLISLPLIHLVSLPRFAAMFPGADLTSPAAIAQAREQITNLVLHGIFTAATPDSNILEASHNTQTAPAYPTQEA